MPKFKVGDRVIAKSVPGRPDLEGKEGILCLIGKHKELVQVCFDIYPEKSFWCEYLGLHRIVEEEEEEPFDLPGEYADY